ncbi:glycine betaine ABC transporter substrate-binding protein [uncultured Schumannella sp.]|jgi:glycine betaine/proline transport system substrate-binding protein|uniref:glycine betaine ABC transporter substrate-binding protein n=1 Tax=uncultured Schumannella sp. TaxID=1195956 RepID=UPI0025EDD625|nr:glycine betaine ABC transporter substrate-binding protein [uncultured Schumannella sp.]
MLNGRTLRRSSLIGGALALTVGLAGCATAETGDAGSDSGESMGTITLGFIPGWTDGLSTAYLLEDQLGKLGYTVEMETLTEAAPLYIGLAGGDVDIYPSAWSEVTHASYMEEYGDDIEDLGTYYAGASLTIAVPTYTEIDSIAELAGNGDMFGGVITGIEPGAGLTALTQDTMMPTYGLDGEYELVTSSTAAMLTELGNAIDAQEDIVVTLWRPFWANAAFDIKTLEDPEGAMGGSEGLHFLGTAGFSEEHPEAAALIANIQLDDAQYGALENLVVNEYGEGQYAEAVDAWLAEYPDAFEGLLAN